MYNGNNDNNSNGPLMAPNIDNSYENNDQGHAINVPHEHVMESTRVSDNYRGVDDIRRDFSPEERIAPPKSVNVNNKNSGIKYLGALILVLLLVGAGIYIFNPFGFGDVISSTAQKVKNDITGITDKFEENYNGHYSYESYDAYVYAIDDNDLYFYITNNTVKVSSIAKIKEDGQSATTVVDGVTYTFKIAKEGLVVNATTDDILSATYEKSESITKEKCFMIEYGTKKLLLDTKYNGVFKYDNTTITMFQVSEKEVHLYISNNGDYRGMVLNIQSDGTLRTNAAIENSEHEKMIITVTKDSINIKHSSATSIEITGDYPKSGELDIDKILKREF